MNNVDSSEKILREILSRKDPSGYYIVVAVNSNDAKNSISRYVKKSQLVIEELGNIIIIRCKSRRVIEEIARDLISKKLVAEV